MPMLAARLLGGLGIVLLTHTMVIAKPTRPSDSKNNDKYRPPTAIVDWAMMYPRTENDHQMVMCQKRSPVLSGSSRGINIQYAR